MGNLFFLHALGKITDNHKIPIHQMKYILTENLLTASRNDCSAFPLPRCSYNKEEIIEEMLRRSSVCSRSTILAVLNCFEETVVNLTKSDIQVNTPLFNTSFSISGVFDGMTDSFDNQRHKVNINLNPGILLRSASKEIKLQKTNKAYQRTFIAAVNDIKTGSVNDIITPDSNIKITGYNIKIAGNHKDAGAYFVNTLSGERIKMEHIVINNPAELILFTLNLPPGNYTFEIVTQYSGGGKLLKEIKKIRLNKVLKVS